MRQQQLIINSKQVQTPLLDYLNSSANAQRAADAPEAAVSVRCDLCADCGRATPAQLEAQGWGLYGDFEFCPAHEAMV